MNSLFDPIRLRILLAAVLCGFVAGCAAEPAPPEPIPTPRLILLYATCSLNRDFIEPYNEAVSFTPELSAFGRESVIFERHNTEAGKSAVAFSSIYSATQADTHGVYLQAMRMRDEVTMLSEVFGAQGYDTFFWDNHPLAKKALHFAQGVDPDHSYSTYGLPGAKARDTSFTSDSPEFQVILQRLVDDPNYRALIIANNAVPHSPYLMKRLGDFRRNHPSEVSDLDEDRVRVLGELYYANHRRLQHDFDNTVDALGLTDSDVAELVALVESAYKVGVAKLDAIFGGIVRTIDDHGLRHQSLIAFTSDHGELMYRDNALTKWAHGWELAPEVIQVPLMIRLPGPSNALPRFSAVTRSIDLYPTLVGLTGFEIDPAWGIEGVDLSPAITDNETAPDLLAYFHTVPPNRRVVQNMDDWPSLQVFYPRSDPELMWVGVRRHDTVFFWRPDEEGSWHHEVYDLAADPSLNNDLFNADDHDHTAMAERLEAYKARLVAHFESPKQPGVNSEEVEMLRSLGYVK